MTDSQVIPLSQRCHDCYEFGHEDCGCGECGAAYCGSLPAGSEQAGRSGTATNTR